VEADKWSRKHTTKTTGSSGDFTKLVEEPEPTLETFSGWVVIKMNRDLLTAKEKKHGLGTWLVGSTTEYLFYKARHSKTMDFEANYEAVELWEDGELLAVFDEEM